MDWYTTWINTHCRSTGVGDNAIVGVTNVFLANRLIVIAEPWYATEEELHECTRRIVRAFKELRFANEHLPAVGNELIKLREERQASTNQARRESAAGVACPLCSGSGWVSVPHPRCVWNGRLVLHPDNQRVVTVAVTCDECKAGFAARDREADRASRDKEAKHPRRPTHREYTRAVHGHDGVAMLRAHEAEQAAAGRGIGGGFDWSNLIGNLLRRAKPTHDEAA